MVEMVPQHRSWPKSKVEQLKGTDTMVRATGQLLYDNLHRVSSCTHVVARQPHRFSLWEVHPVVQFEVCKHTGACDPGNDGEWEELQ